jgi:hypothetical protein
MRDTSRTGDPLVAALANDETIDWALEDSGGTTTRDDFVRQLRTIARFRAQVVARDNRRRSGWPVLVWAYSAIVAAAVVKIGVVAWNLAAGDIPMAGGIAAQATLQIITMLLYATGGLALVVGGGRDTRARTLGALFLIIASSFANPFLASAGNWVAAALGAELRLWPFDALLAAALWLFVREFPTRSHHRIARQLADAFLAASVAIGIVLLAANVLLGHGVFDAGSLGGRVASFFDRNLPTLGYWPLLFGIALPALPYLIWKSTFEANDTKQRAAWLTFAVALGISPILLAVIATPFVSALQTQAPRDVIRWLLFLPLMSLVPSTTYAVVVHRVLDVHLIVRKAAQHRLARNALWVISVSPLLYLAAQIYSNRDLTISEIIASDNPMTLLLPPVAGLCLLAFRERLLLRVDRWFLRDEADYAEAFARLDRGYRGTRSVRELSTLLRDEIDRTMHPKALAVLVARESANTFASIDGEIEPLDAHSMLIQLLYSVRASVQINLQSASPTARLLPEGDQRWLIDEQVQALVPLFGSGDRLLGFIALGESKGGLPYTKRDLTFLTAIGGHAAIVLENRQLRDVGREATAPRSDTPINWLNEPGMQCARCGSMVFDAERCRCGGDPAPAALPLVVNGKFRVERLVGSGGMGIVYLAVDLTLDRKVAIKTLPTMTPARAGRLEREARAMASVLHPNLACIYGTERWRGTPLLIVEYLEGGTLADRLMLGPLEVVHVLDIGIVIADVLDRVHRSGLLHRDVKPSNIGFTADGLPKLLDFGLATMVESDSTDDTERSIEPLPTNADLSNSASDASLLASGERLVGTPRYLSPEALDGATPHPSFDLWSLSLVLYEAIAGVNPFDADDVDAILRNIRSLRVPDVRDFRDRCPAPVAAFLNDGLSTVHARRPADAAQFRHRLRELRNHS